MKSNIAAVSLEHRERLITDSYGLNHSRCPWGMPLQLLQQFAEVADLTKQNTWI